MFHVDDPSSKLIHFLEMLPVALDAAGILFLLSISWSLGMYSDGQAWLHLHN